MKKWLVIVCLLAGFRLQGQQYEIEQLLLNFDKLTQLRQILADMKTGYEIIVQGYDTIKNIAEGNFGLHRQFLDKLLEVSPALRNSYRVKEIIAWQLIIANEHKTAWQRFAICDLLNSSEKKYVSGFYKNILRESLQALSDLMLLITSGRLRMSDDERMIRIERVHTYMGSYLTSLRSFNGRVADILIERERTNAQLDIMKSVHGIEK